jgi:hypothetical protein
MSAKLLAQTVKKLGETINEALCINPDENIIRLLLDEIKNDLLEFEKTYFKDQH